MQTLSRLNRAHPHKRDTFVLDFVNDADTILAAFQPYYRTTILSAETNPASLHDLKADLDNAQVYGEEQVHLLVQLYVNGAPRERLHRFWTPVRQSTSRIWMKKGRLRSRARPRRSCAPIIFSRWCCPTPMPSGDAGDILDATHPQVAGTRRGGSARGILDAVDMDSYRRGGQGGVGSRTQRRDWHSGPSSRQQLDASARAGDRCAEQNRARVQRGVGHA